MSWRRSLESLFALVVIAAAFGLVWTKVINVEKPVRAAPPLDVGPVPVTVVELQEQSLPLEVRAYGTLEPLRRVALTSELMGRVAKVLADWRPGAEVQQGTSLLVLDTVQAELAVDLAQARVAEAEVAEASAVTEQHTAEALIEKAEDYLELATRERVRLTTLETTGEVSPKLADDARAAEILAANSLQEMRGRLEAGKSSAAVARASQAVALATVAQAEDQRARLELRAPFTGRLTIRGPATGALIGPGTSLGELVDTATLLLVANVHEDRLAGLRLGQAATVSLPSRPGASFAATVHAIGSQADPATRSVPVELRFENVAPADQGEPLQAGLFAEATISLGVRDAAISIERGEFSWIDGLPFAFVIAKQGGALSATARPIVLGPPVGEGFLVEGGLATGERIVTSPLDRMSVTTATLVRELAGEVRR
ncbi:MAG: HlyD family secretion protein [Pseudohongiellaceae bacterium]|jgi:HlyD family secretion protein